MDYLKKARSENVKRFFLFVTSVIVLTLWVYCDPVYAHGFGQRYDLPVPLRLWVLGAGATILVSFFLVAIFAKGEVGQFSYPRVNLLQWRMFRLFRHNSVLFSIRAIGVIVLVAAIVAGFWGNTDPYKNVTPVLVWVIWWVGVVYVCALVADVWALVNPFRTIFIWAEHIARKWFGADRLSLNQRYPPVLEMWPAVLGLIGFFWAELLWTAGSVPLNLAIVITTYACITWLGMFVYGRETWLQNADPFCQVFKIFSGFAPLETRVRLSSSEQKCQAYACRYRYADCVNGYGCIRESRADQLEWNLRPPGVGLSQEIKAPISMMVFVLILLASVTFDGFLETPLWIKILDRSMGQEIVLIGNLGLVLISMLFCVVYLVFCWFVIRVATLFAESSSQWEATNSLEIACAFVLTLVPIAIAYHLAHYLSFLLITGQYLVPLLSDPLGFGWNIFGTAGYRPNIGVLDARTSWYVAVGAVICGHVFSVYIAHKVAVRVFNDVRVALYSQIPMIILMVLYTMLSLWILAQPMVG